MKPTQFAAASSSPIGVPARRTWMSSATPRDGEGERARVATGARAVRRECDDAEELDAGDGRERQPVEGEVEGGVHGGENATQGDDQQALVAPGRAPDRPRRADHREHERGRGHPQPGDAHGVEVGEEEHRERRPEVVEGRADHHEAAADRRPDAEAGWWLPSPHRPSHDGGVEVVLAGS